MSYEDNEEEYEDFYEYEDEEEDAQVGARRSAGPPNSAQAPCLHACALLAVSACVCACLCVRVRVPCLRTC